MFIFADSYFPYLPFHPPLSTGLSLSRTHFLLSLSPSFYLPLKPSIPLLYSRQRSSSACGRPSTRPRGTWTPWPVLWRRSTGPRHPGHSPHWGRAATGQTLDSLKTQNAPGGAGAGLCRGFLSCMSSGEDPVVELQEAQEEEAQ